MSAANFMQLIEVLTFAKKLCVDSFVFMLLWQINIVVVRMQQPFYLLSIISLFSHANVTHTLKFFSRH